jgi:hypothetical protein
MAQKLRLSRREVSAPLSFGEGRGRQPSKFQNFVDILQPMATIEPIAVWLPIMLIMSGTFLEDAYWLPFSPCPLLKNMGN